MQSSDQSFGQKFEFFSPFLRSNTPEKVCHDVLDRKSTFLHNKNIEFKKVQNLHFC